VNVRWWCAASSGAWTWTPQAFPGVWLFMALVGGAWLWAVLRVGPRRVGPGQPVLTRSQATSFAIGWLLLWALLDWPIGPLAAGYLATAHMIQYVTITLVVAPLLESGLPGWMRAAIFAPRAMAPLRWIVERPFRAFALLNTVLVATHVPVVADSLKPLQLGSMAMDLTWILAALLFWLSTTPLRESVRIDAVYGRRLLYLIGSKLTPILLGAILVHSEFPLYRTFELAPRVFELTAKTDQVIAGWLMWMGATPLLIWRLASAWFVWAEIEARRAGEV